MPIPFALVVLLHYSCFLHLAASSTSNLEVTSRFIECKIVLVLEIPNTIVIAIKVIHPSKDPKVEKYHEQQQLSYRLPWPRFLSCFVPNRWQ
ncbi:hypothetical protein M0R45_019089 [Rubus argutus]|uniref:Secreted protein n=1 Tax=Rubus argutus TaxID=59490 RepID=A0AAW1X6Z1_RUBAR